MYLINFYIMDFGTSLQLIRKEKKLTQQDLSDLTDYDKRMISRWEGGNTKPNIEAAVTLAKALGVSLDVLTGIKPQQASAPLIDPELSKLLSLAAKLPKKDITTIKEVLRLIVGK